MKMTLGQAFARSTRKYPAKRAVMDDAGLLTYKDLALEPGFLYPDLIEAIEEVLRPGGLWIAQYDN